MSDDFYKEVNYDDASDDDDDYRPRSQGAIVFSNVRLWLCLFVCERDNSWTVRDIITSRNCQGIITAEREVKFENGYCGVRGWCENVLIGRGVGKGGTRGTCPPPGNSHAEKLGFFG